MATPTALQNLQAAYNNYTQILVLVTQVVVNPTQANIDAAVNLIDRSGVIRPKATSSVDGENYDWTGYQTFVLDKLEVLEKAIQRASGPFQLATRWRT